MVGFAIAWPTAVLKEPSIPDVPRLANKDAWELPDQEAYRTDIELPNWITNRSLQVDRMFLTTANSR